LLSPTSFLIRRKIDELRGSYILVRGPSRVFFPLNFSPITGFFLNPIAIFSLPPSHLAPLLICWRGGLTDRDTIWLTAHFLPSMQQDAGQRQ
jgi:hypothetical protein